MQKVAEQLKHLISPVCAEFESHVHRVKSTWITVCKTLVTGFMLPFADTCVSVVTYWLIVCSQSAFGSHLSFGAFSAFLS